MTIAGCLALFAGVVLAAHVRQGPWCWLLLPGMYWLRRQGITALLVVVLFCFGLGWWRGSVLQRQLGSYRALSRQGVLLVGRAASDGVYGKQSQLAFDLAHIRVIRPLQTSLPGSLSISGFGASAVSRGDIIQVSGKLYPTRGNNLATISFAELRVLESKPSVIDAFRRKFTAGLQSALPEPQAPFGLGLLVGQRNTLPPEVSQQLLMVGLTHIIAVSGYNLTIMVEAARRLFGKRSKFQTLAACCLLILGFLLLAGNSPSLVRASIISMLSIGAWYYGRTMQPVALLLVAAAVTVLANPLYLWGNVSWYLSFLAFFGVVVIAPLATARLFGGRQPPLVAKMVIESLAAEAMTLPYVLYIFGQMSTVSLLGNVLIAALVPLAMLLCVAAGLAGMLVAPAAGWLAWPATLVLTYMLDAAALLSRLPRAFIEHIAFGIGSLLGSYALVAWLVWLLHRRAKVSS